MSGALEEHEGKVSIGGRIITNLLFADYIDALTGELQELEALVKGLDKTCTRYKMEISAEKTKLTKIVQIASRGGQGGRTEAGYCEYLQITWDKCLR